VSNGISHPNDPALSPQPGWERDKEREGESERLRERKRGSEGEMERESVPLSLSTFSPFSQARNDEMR